MHDSRVKVFFCGSRDLFLAFMYFLQVLGPCFSALWSIIMGFKLSFGVFKFESL